MPDRFREPWYSRHWRLTLVIMYTVQTVAIVGEMYWLLRHER